MFGLTSGRYEYRNKGVDVLIEALSRVNHSLKHQKDSKTLIVFMVFPTAHRGHNEALNETFAMARHCETIENEFASRIRRKINFLTSNDANEIKIDLHDLVSEQDKVEFRRMVEKAQSFSRSGSITTHNIQNDATDPILNDLRRCQLFNAKVI